MRALRGQPAAAVRVAEALAVLFADLREQNGHSVQYVCLPGGGASEGVLRGAAVCSLCAWKIGGKFDFADFELKFVDNVKKSSGGSGIICVTGEGFDGHVSFKIPLEKSYQQGWIGHN